MHQNPNGGVPDANNDTNGGGDLNANGGGDLNANGRGNNDGGNPGGSLLRARLFSQRNSDGE